MNKKGLGLGVEFFSSAGQFAANEIKDDQPLFGPGSLGLDSVDALQLVVALDKHFGLKIADPGQAKEILVSGNTMAAAVSRSRTA
jgi:acyl carrier protein